MNKEQFIKYACDELIHKGNLDIIPTVFSEDYVAHAGNKIYRGHDFLKRWMKQVQTAIQNMKVSKIQLLSQEEQTLTWQRTLTGTHIEPLQGIPASHKKVTWTEMVVSNFEADKIKEEWIVSKLAAMLFIALGKK